MNILEDRNSVTWFRTIKRCPNPRVRLLCFPHAGGAASFFRSWAEFVPDGVEAVAVRYPGREDRLFDPMADSLEDLALRCGLLSSAPRRATGSVRAQHGGIRRL